MSTKIESRSEPLVAMAQIALGVGVHVPAFIHGAGGNRMTWHLQLAHPKGAIAIDLPGHPNGRGCETIKDYADEVSRYVSDRRIPKPTLVGHSMGGAIAIELALREPSTAGLVLVGTGAKLRVRSEFLEMVKSNYEEACNAIASWSVSPSSDPVVAARIASDMMKIEPEVTYGDFVACDRFDRMNDVEGISCPTLIVCGVDDRMTPPKYSQYLHEKIQGSRLLMVPAAGHAVMLEKSRVLNDAIEAFAS